MTAGLTIQAAVQPSRPRLVRAVVLVSGARCCDALGTGGFSVVVVNVHLLL